MNSINIIRIVELCRDNYDEKTFNHAVRVANLALKNPIAKELDTDRLYGLAISHDLIEDTSVTYEQIGNCLSLSNDFVEEVLSLVTKEKGRDYIEYIKDLRASNNLYAYTIKLADMKDHLLQKDTLTDKLKEKYWNAIPELL